MEKDLKIFMSQIMYRNWNKFVEKLSIIYYKIFREACVISEEENK